MRDIGVDVNKPEGEWDGSKNCPFYGTLELLHVPGSLPLDYYCVLHSF